MQVETKLEVYGEYLRTPEGRRKIFMSFIQPFRLVLEYTSKAEDHLSVGCRHAARQVELFDAFRAHCESPDEYAFRGLLSVIGDLRGLINAPVMVKRRQAAPPDEYARTHAIEMNFLRMFDPKEDTKTQVQRALKTA